MAALCSTCWAMPRAGSAQATFTGLGDLPGGAFQSQAEAVSDDGVAVVGIGTAATGPQAFRWQAVGGMVGLGGLPGGPVFSFAFGVSGDGSVVVGNAIPDAFVWDAERGMRSVRDVLAAAGADVEGWTLEIAFAVSADGRTVVGVGTNPSGQKEAWLAVLPPSRCQNGLDDDGDGLADHPADPGCARARATSRIRNATTATTTTRTASSTIPPIPAASPAPIRASGRRAATHSTTISTARPTSRKTPAAPTRTMRSKRPRATTASTTTATDSSTSTIRPATPTGRTGNRRRAESVRSSRSGCRS